MSTLRWSTGVYASAVLVDRLLGLFLLPLLTRSISPADYGAWTQTAITASMLMPIVLFGFSTTIVRYFSTAAVTAMRRRYFWRLGMLALALFVVCGVCVTAFPGPVSHAIFGDSAKQILLPSLLMLLAADATADYACAWLRASGRIGLVAATLIARSFTRYGVVLALVGQAPPSMAVWFAQYAGTQLIVSFLVFCLAAAVVTRQKQVSAETSDSPDLNELLRFSAPLVLLALLTWMGGSFDRFLLLHSLDLESVAFYAAAVSLCAIPAVIHSVLGFTLFPVLSEHWQAGRLAEICKLMSLAVRVFLFLTVPMALLLAIAGPRLLSLFATVEYRAEAPVFALLAVSVAAFGVYQILLYALLLEGRSKQVLGLAGLAVAVNLALNLALIPGLGLVGAATAAATSNIVMVCLAVRLARAALPWSFPWQESLRILANAVAASLPLLLLMAYGSGSLAASALGSALSLSIYLGLDWSRSASIARLLARP
ncbi:oligosaccharide flippase family protein [Variovorax sp. RA8]|uniref:oligosaccharide flippase family protein n=1 Tax=Variovorax sp. (strain JCM 16519 / RA8) TaxID=662548 RepID=UPI00131703C2|nr:oligosaccharide flippase family protein [Variovorax sp. RA8]VTU38018.1 integral membrane protein MviN [Variovorax sp. RA8]